MSESDINPPDEVLRDGDPDDEGTAEERTIPSEDLEPRQPAEQQHGSSARADEMTSNQ
jgi:hypothetical protein